MKKIMLRYRFLLFAILHLGERELLNGGFYCVTIWVGAYIRNFTHKCIMGIQFRILALFSATYVVAKKARTAVKTARMGMVNPNVSHFVTRKKAARKYLLLTN